MKTFLFCYVIPHLHGPGNLIGDSKITMPALTGVSIDKAREVIFEQAAATSEIQLRGSAIITSIVPLEGP